MDVRGTRWWRSATKLAACFLLGASAGGAVMLVLLGDQVDQLYAELHKRNNELQQLQDELESLQEELSVEQKEEAIQGIDLNLLERRDQNLNKVTREMINAEVYQWLKQMNIIGEPVSRYEELPQFFRETINHHTVKLDQKEYQLRFEAVSIGSRIRIWFYVQEVVDDVAIW